MRRVVDGLVLLAIGAMVLIVGSGGIASLAHVVGPNAPTLGGDRLWLTTGIGGFVLGLSWRFLFWDLPGIAWRFLSANRRNLQYMAVVCAGIALLVLV